MPKAFGYCRLSKEEITVTCTHCKQEWALNINNTEQTDHECPYCQTKFHQASSSPVSIQTQRDKIVDLALSKLPRTVDGKLEMFVDINVSGKIPVRDRDQGAILFQKIQDGDYLIVSKLDRLFRDLEDCCKQIKMFQKMGIHLVMGDLPEVDINCPTGELFVKIIAIVAEWERKRIVERTKEGLKKRKELDLPVSSAVPRGMSLVCNVCDHVYTYEECRKGKTCPHCKAIRNGNTHHAPNLAEQTLMWRIMWYRSAYQCLEWDMILDKLHEDGIRTRSNCKISRRWARYYMEDGCRLLEAGKLLFECRPAYMENLTLTKIISCPKDVLERLVEKSRDSDA